MVRSAFGHAGQKCSAASLAILVGPVGRSRRFARQLVDATRSLRVGSAHDPLSEVGPLIGPPGGKLAWALTELDPGESWLVKPRPLPAPDGVPDDGRLWTPGIRIGVRPGSRMHREEFFGPVLGILQAATLDQAVALQNAVDYGLTAGLHTQDPAELDRWLQSVEAGNLYVNRGITGAVVQRQPFGGWKRSSVGAGAKAGGPNHLVGLGSWRPTAGGPASQSLHLRGLDTRIAAVIEAAQPSLGYDEFEWLRRAALSDALAWDREYGRVKDVSRLGVERNLFRYRSAPVAVRATEDASWRAVLRVVLAGLRAGGRFSLSVPEGIPAGVRHALGALDVPVWVETQRQWFARLGGPAEPDLTDRAASDAAALAGPAGREAPADPDASPEEVSADADAVPTTGELLGLAPERPERVRLVGPPESVAALHRALATAVAGDPDLAVHAGEVTTAGRLELLPFLREQSVSITAHRFGEPDDWSAEVI